MRNKDKLYLNAVYAFDVFISGKARYAEHHKTYTVKLLGIINRGDTELCECLCMQTGIKVNCDKRFLLTLEKVQELYDKFNNMENLDKGLKLQVARMKYILAFSNQI